MQSDEEAYISIDVETAGPIPGTYSLLSLGACLVSDPAQSFYAELLPITDAAVPEALAISGLSLEALRERGEEPRAVLERLRDWIQQVSPSRTPVFVGFNAAFDWSFVNWYFYTFLGSNPFGFAPLDVKAFYMGLTGCLFKQTTSRQLPPEFQPSSAGQEHNALADARAQAETFQKLLLASRARR